jgi:hypothetical protein
MPKVLRFPADHEAEIQKLERLRASAREAGKRALLLAAALDRQIEELRFRRPTARRRTSCGPCCDDKS